MIVRSMSMMVTAALLATRCIGSQPKQDRPAADRRATTSPSRAAPGDVAITHVTLIDGTGRTPRQDVTVLVRGGRIAEIFPSDQRSLTAGTREVDGRGKFIIPGLIDSHVHTGTIMNRPVAMNEAILHNAFLGGVTTARDMGGRTATVMPLAVRAALDTTPWPRLYLSAIMAGPGTWVDGPRGAFMAGTDAPGTSALVRRVDSATNIQQVISDAKSAGATGIKIYNSVSAPVIRSLVLEAHRQGLRAWSHLSVDPVRPGEVIGAGVDAVSHADMFIREMMPDLPAGTSNAENRNVRHRTFLSTSVDAAPITRMLVAMREHQTALDATLFIMAPRPDSTGKVSPQSVVLFHFAAAMVRRASRMGVPIVVGTDHLGGGSPNIHAELQLLVDSAGLTPGAAIRAATSDAARVLGAQDSLGTITPGKLADLVVLAGDPLADIANTQTIVLVMKGGRIYDRLTPLSEIPFARQPPSVRRPPN